MEPSLIKISAGLQIPIVWSSSPQHTATIIRRAALQLFKLTGSSPVIRTPERKEDLHFQQRYVLVGLPGIGLARAEALLNKFGSLAGVFAASEKDIAETPGMGSKLAGRIKYLLTQQHGESK